MIIISYPFDEDHNTQALFKRLALGPGSIVYKVHNAAGKTLVRTEEGKHIYIRLTYLSLESIEVAMKLLNVTGKS